MLALSVAVWLWGENRELQGRVAEQKQERDSTALAARESDSRDPATGPTPAAQRQRQDEPGGLRQQPRRSEPRSVFSPPKSSRTGEKISRQPGGKETQDRRVAGTEGEAPTKGPVEDQPEGRPTVVAIPAVEAEKNGDSLFKNGGFNKELSPWTCESGRVIQEPGNPENSVLEITPGEGSFVLSQNFQRSVTSRKLLLSWRVKGTTEKLVPLEISLRMQNGKEFLVYSSILPFRKDRLWTPSTMDLELSGSSRPVGLVIKSKATDEPLWIDDVVVQEVKSTSFAGGQ